MYNQAMILCSRWIAANLLGIALVVIAYLHGWIEQIFYSDATYLSWVIGMAFLWGMALTAHRLIWTCQQIALVERGNETAQVSEWKRFWGSVRLHGNRGDAFAVEAFKGRMQSRIALIRHIANLLVLIGLIGTVIGFIVALSGVDADTVGDVSKIGTMVATLIQGMSIALYTTLVGAILNVWLMLNYHILAIGMTLLVSLIMEMPSVR